LADAGAPFYSRGERVIAQLQAIGIRTRLQTWNGRSVVTRKAAAASAAPPIGIGWARQ